MVMEKVGEVIASIEAAKCVEEVICALHSLAALFFPVDSLSLLGSISEKYRDEILGVRSPNEDERKELWRSFYKGGAFPALSRFLLYDVASNWLACFPISARKNVYDVFFVNGYVVEVLQAVVPCLRHAGGATYDVSAVCLNAERLIVICLLENHGVSQMVKDFEFSSQYEDQQFKHAISLLAQLVTSIPDKARPQASVSLASHMFFKRITSQLLLGAEEWSKDLSSGAEDLSKVHMDFSILFTGETFSRICRRGSADVMLSEVLPQVLGHVQSCLSTDANMTVAKAFQLRPVLQFWSQVMKAIKDSYAVERMSEQILHQLVAQNVNDVEAYWILSIMFHQIYQQKSIRSMFVDKFFLWKVFPICCLRWIIHFAILECSPDALGTKVHNVPGIVDTVRRLVVVWSKQEFLQSATLEQQIYITAALGLCLEKMSKEDLDATKDVIHSILKGVSCRLESPDNLIRKMASNIALAFSKVIDPKNPLYLDDSCHEENIDWELGLATSDKTSGGASHNEDGDSNNAKSSPDVALEKEVDSIGGAGMSYNAREAKKKPSEFKLVDPDEVVDPVTLNSGSHSDGEEDDVASEDSEASSDSSDSSLQPYDLTDDDTDLKRKFSHLIDVVGALRKSDDADGVEMALDVVEKLVRASPDELKYVAGDLVRTLVQVRCSDFTVEGQEASAEEKRQKAIVSLIVTRPPESLETLHRLLYSPNLDVSQRIMILDVMTDSALELANTRIVKPEERFRPLISSMSNQPWFMPKNIDHPGSSLWKEISMPGMPLKWSYSYERELPAKPGHIKRGNTRRWSLRSSVKQNEVELSQNEFPQYAAAFMLPAMQGFDKKRHGVDLLGRDFIVLGKLIHMLGVCIKCAAMHPEASVLASPLLDMLSSREISYHAEAYVRRSVLFAASCILVALHPSYVASALVEGNAEISKGLDWIRTWAHHITESDTDRDCFTLAMTCLQLHSEMALQTSRALELAENTANVQGIGLPMDLARGIIKFPHGNVRL